MCRTFSLTNHAMKSGLCRLSWDLWDCLYLNHKTNRSNRSWRAPAYECMLYLYTKNCQFGRIYAQRLPVTGHNVPKYLLVIFRGLISESFSQIKPSRTTPRNDKTARNDKAKQKKNSESNFPAPPLATDNQSSSSLLHRRCSLHHNVFYFMLFHNAGQKSNLDGTKFSYVLKGGSLMKPSFVAIT